MLLGSINLRVIAGLRNLAMVDIFGEARDHWCNRPSVNGFMALNIAMLLLAVACWLRPADQLKIGSNGKWLGGALGLIVSAPESRLGSVS